jgi:hypothetical protein
VYLGGAMGINIWLMKGYLDTIPRESMNLRWWKVLRTGKYLES